MKRNLLDQKRATQIHPGLAVKNSRTISSSDVPPSAQKTKLAGATSGLNSSD
jgi:hypothetical protein